MERTTSESAQIEPILTTETARILNVSADTVREWERRGRLTALKTHRGVRLFDRREVERLARKIKGD